MKSPRDLTLTTRDAPPAKSEKVHHLKLQIQELQQQNKKLKERNADLARKLALISNPQFSDDDIDMDHEIFKHFEHAISRLNIELQKSKSSEQKLKKKLIKQSEEMITLLDKDNLWKIHVQQVERAMDILTVES